MTTKARRTSTLLAATLMIGAVVSAGCGSTDNTTDVSTASADSSPTVSAARAGRAWAPSRTALLHPGVQVYTGEGQCTANFVFVDAAKQVYLGQAAHCAEIHESKRNGCHTATRPLGTKITFNRKGNSSSLGQVIATGTLAYDSWRTMQERHETGSNKCNYNDFALVQVDTKYAREVNPSVPFWGGPAGLNTTGAAANETVYAYGNSSLRGGLTQLSPQKGVADADNPAREHSTHEEHSRTPGVPGDSGSAFLDSKGRALGTLSTVALTLPVVNAMGDIHRELKYARAYSGIKGLKLVLGTQRFNSSATTAFTRPPGA